MTRTRLGGVGALLLLCGTFTAADDGGENIRCRGRVLSPEGKPVPRARVFFIRHFLDDQNEPGDLAAARGQTGADGRFRFEVLPSQGTDPGGTAMLLAVAPGYGPGWRILSRPEQALDATLTLVKDDVPISGRVVDLEGKPVAGATVEVRGLGVTQGQAKEDLGPWLEHLRTKKTFYDRSGPHMQLGASSAGLTRSVRCGRDGTFRLDGFGRERLVKLRFSGPAIETREVCATTRPGGTAVVQRYPGEPQWGTITVHGATFTHAAAPSRPIVGVVRDRSTGKPVAGVRVSALMPFPQRIDNDGLIETKTDRDGRYRLDGLPRAAGQAVEVSPEVAQGYLPLSGRTGKAADLDAVRLDFALVRGIRVRGRVTDKATGKPVRAQVAYFAFADNPHLKDVPGFRGVGRYERMTDADGRYTLVALPGRGIVTASTPKRRNHGGRGAGYLVGLGSERIKGQNERGQFITWPSIVDLRSYNALVGLDLARDAGEAAFDLVLDPGRTVRGTVVDPDGKPLTGAEVTGTVDYRSAPRKPLATAQFTLPAVDLRKPQVFFFQHKKKKLGALLVVDAGKTEGIAVKLKPCGVITGRLLDRDRVPLAGRYLIGYVEDGQKHIPRGWTGSFVAGTGKDGRFRAEVIPGVQVGAYLEISMTRLGAKVFQKITVEAGKAHDVGDLEVDP